MVFNPTRDRSGLAYRRQALPIWWRVQRETGATGRELQAEFLEKLAKLVSPEAESILIGDGRALSVTRRRDQWSERGPRICIFSNHPLCT